MGMILELCSLSGNWRSVSKANIPTEFVRTTVGAFRSIFTDDFLYELEGRSFFKRYNKRTRQLFAKIQFSGFVAIAE